MDPTQFKTGWKTSEFWVALVAMAAPLVAAFTGYTIDSAQLGPVVGGFVSAVIYVFGRTWLKRKRIDGVAATTATAPAALTAEDLIPPDIATPASVVDQPAAT